MLAPNPYEVNDDDSRDVKDKTVNIKMLDVLFDNQVCSLVYMTDLTKVMKDNEKSLA